MHVYTKCSHKPILTQLYRAFVSVIWAFSIGNDNLVFKLYVLVEKASLVALLAMAP